MNLCDYCHRAERDCPIWAPSGLVEKCKEWQPITRHEYRRVVLERSAMLKLYTDLAVNVSEKLDALLSIAKQLGAPR